MPQCIYSQDKSNIITGSDSGTRDFRTPSIDYSDYLCGQMSKDVNFRISKMKIVRTKIVDKGNVLFNIIPIDQFGNFIQNLTNKELEFDAILEKDYVKYKSMLKFQSESKLEKSKKTNLHILVENSILTTNLQDILRQIRNLIPKLMPTDSISVSLFNQKIQNILPIESAQAAYLKLSVENVKCSGTNSAINVLYQKLNELETHKSDANNIIVQIYTGYENSSFIDTYGDIIDRAKDLNIPIYTVGIGTKVRSFQTQPLSEATGARYYDLQEENLENLSAILNEIYYSDKVFYQYKLTPDAFSEEWDNLVMQAALYNGADFLDNFVDIYFKAPDIMTTNKILAIYDKEESFPDTNSFESYQMIALYMQNNPTIKMEITGYTDNESKTTELALSRADKVRDAIVSFGVNPRRFVLKSAGDEEPIYTSSAPQNLLALNRRTELKWLREEDKPAEIKGELAESEFMADQFVITWEKIGYKAYYKRTVINGETMYKVILWNYETNEQAAEEINRLKATFQDIEFKVE